MAKSFFLWRSVNCQEGINYGNCNKSASKKSGTRKNCRCEKTGARQNGCR